MNILERTGHWLVKTFKRDMDSRTPRGFNLLFGGNPTMSGKQVSQRSSIGLSAVYHAVDLISQDYASLPHKVYSYTTTGKDVLNDHPNAKVLNFEPNYYQTPLEFHRMMGVFRLMYGNAYAIIERDTAGNVINLLPVHPDKVKYIVEVERELFYQIDGITSMVSGRDMIHVKDLNIEDHDPNELFKGKARIDACREAVGKGLALQEYTSTFFGNGANVGMVLESEVGALEDEEQRRAIQNSLKNYQGSENAHEPLVLPWGIKLSHGPTKFNQQQTQFIETNIFHVQEVAQIFNLPLHKMRIDSDGNSYNSVEQANIEYITDTLKPFAIAFEQEYNRKLFRNSEKGQVFVQASTKKKQMADLSTVAAYVDTMIKNGTFSINMALEHLEENTIGAEGDIRYIQSNQMPLGENPISNGETNN